MSRYMQYSMAAAKEALDDAKWYPENECQKEMTVFQIASVLGMIYKIAHGFRASA